MNLKGSIMEVDMTLNLRHVSSCEKLHFYHVLHETKQKNCRQTVESAHVNLSKSCYMFF